MKENMHASSFLLLFIHVMTEEVMVVVPFLAKRKETERE